MILEENKKLIERFVSLATCTDYNIDSNYRWFYSKVSRRELFNLCIDPEDIRHDIVVFILEQKKKYKGRDFNAFLPLSLARYVRDHLKKLIKQSKIQSTNSYVYNYATELEWMVSKDNLPLTIYERFLLYLNLQQCYTVNEIAKFTYQDRSTVRKTLQTAKQILKQELL
jgi:DNA-directed RNA polymerase specialized sigma24 family protein